MSERIYIWLLRLFPPHFRQVYGEEALQLFRDRYRDEKGFFLRLRLWLDLLLDLAKSLPSEYRYAYSELTGTSQQRAFNGAPTFYLLGAERPRPGALFGGFLWVVMLLTLPLLFNPSGSSGTAGPEMGGESKPGLQTASVSKQQTSGHETSSVVFERWELDAAERHRVVAGAAAKLKQHYIDPQLAHEMSDSLLTHEKNGDDDLANDGDVFALLLTRQMRDISHDNHLELVFSRTPLPVESGEPTPEALAYYREVLRKQNCGFERVEVHPGNVGYLKLNAFPDPTICESIARTALARVNNTRALIFDLRDNRGGQPRMVALIAAYLFDHPAYFYNPRESTSEKSWTPSPVAGNHLADKPVYVLTSTKTISGAEQFCYNLKMLKRATLVGEKTAGAAHAGVWHRIDDHFGMGIPEVRPLNPYSTTDWEQVGVEPDVKVGAADALVTAEKLLQKKLSRR